MTLGRRPRAAIAAAARRDGRALASSAFVPALDAALPVRALGRPCPARCAAPDRARDRRARRARSRPGRPRDPSSPRPSRARPRSAIVARGSRRANASSAALLALALDALGVRPARASIRPRSRLSSMSAPRHQPANVGVSCVLRLATASARRRRRARRRRCAGKRPLPDVQAEQAVRAPSPAARASGTVPRSSPASAQLRALRLEREDREQLVGVVAQVHAVGRGPARAARSTAGTAPSRDRCAACRRRCMWWRTHADEVAIAIAAQRDRRQRRQAPVLTAEEQRVGRRAGGELESGTDRASATPRTHRSSRRPGRSR